MLSNEVIVHFGMLHACMEHWVPSQMNIAHVVIVKENLILDGYAQIVQYYFEPNNFTCNDYNAPIFGLYG